ncbi:transporter substrate-binding protein [Mesorhizobium sp. M1307]
MNYFSGVRSRANERFLETYHDSFGELAPAVNQACQSCYDGVNIVASLAKNLGRSDAAALARSFRRPVSGRPIGTIVIHLSRSTDHIALTGLQITPR